MPSEHDEGRIEALRAIIREGAPHLAFTDRESYCVQIHIAFWLFQAELMQQFDAGRINKTQYLRMFNERARHMVEMDKDVLGNDFYKIFGEEGEAIENLINPDLFINGDPSESGFIRYG